MIHVGFIVHVGLVLTAVAMANQVVKKALSRRTLMLAVREFLYYHDLQKIKTTMDGSAISWSMVVNNQVYPH